MVPSNLNKENGFLAPKTKGKWILWDSEQTEHGVTYTRRTHPYVSTERTIDHLLPKEQYIPVSVKIKQNGTLIIVSTGGYHYQPEEEMEQIPLRSQQVNITEETKMRFLNAVKRGEGSIVADGSYKAGRSSAAIVVQHEKSDIKSEN